VRVLVVDDDPAGRYLLRSIVASGGHEVVEAENGAQALESALSDPPAIVVTDILMPIMDGYQLCRAWKEDQTLAGVPLVFYTASYTDPADERFARSLGADAFWRKPMDADELLRGIAELASERATQASVRRPELTDEREILREYNERLVHKLEEKATSLEKANAELRRAMEILAEEVSIKANLIAELNADVLRRKRVEAELRDERDFTRSVIELADLFIVVLDESGKVVLFSKGAERISGYRIDEVLGTSYRSLFVPDERQEEFDILMGTLAKSGVPQRYVGAVLTKDGKRRAIDWSTTATFSDAGELRSIIGFGADVTDRLRATGAERVAAAAEHGVVAGRSRADILQSVSELLLEHFDVGLVRVASPDGESGIQMRAAAGDTALAERLAGDASMHFPLASAIRDREPVLRLTAAADDEWARAARESGFASALAIPLLADGAVLGAIGLYSHDPQAFDEELREILGRLAERVGVALMLVESRDQLAQQSAGLTSAAESICITDAEHRIVWANPAFSDLTGYGPDEVEGLSQAQISPDAEEFSRLLDAIADANGGAVRLETVGVRKNGQRFWAEVTIAPVAGLDETRYVWIERDITEARRFEQMKSGFVASVSHELRTPLTSIIGFTDLLGQMKPDALADRGLEIVSKVRAHSLHLKQLVEELLEVSMMQEEGLRLQLRDADLEQVVRVHADAVPRTSDHRLSVAAAPDLPLVRCDPERLGRAIASLVDNAVKYSPDGGPIDVTVAVEADAATITVADAGVGIEPEQLPYLFDRFRQGDMSSTRSYGGMGLGLFVAAQVVEAHGGTIEVESTPGAGSTFTIRIPLSGPAQ